MGGSSWRLASFVSQLHRVAPRVQIEPVQCVTLRRMDPPCLLRNRVVADVRMSRAEFAVTITHGLAWERLVASGRPYGIICEDDAIFLPGFEVLFEATISALAEFTTPVDMLALWNGDWTASTYRGEGQLVTEVSLSDNVLVQERAEFITNHARNTSLKALLAANLTSSVRVYNFSTTFVVPGGVAYMLSSAYAQFLLSELFPLRRPADHYLGMGSVKEETSHATWNCFVVEPALPFQSLLEPTFSPFVMTNYHASVKNYN